MNTNLFKKKDLLNLLKVDHASYMHTIIFHIIVIIVILY